MGARFEALDEGILAEASKSTGYFFAISISQKVRCIGYGIASIDLSKDRSLSKMFGETLE